MTTAVIAAAAIIAADLAAIAGLRWLARRTPELIRRTEAAGYRTAPVTNRREKARQRDGGRR